MNSVCSTSTCALRSAGTARPALQAITVELFATQIMPGLATPDS